MFSWNIKILTYDFVKNRKPFQVFVRVLYKIIWNRLLTEQFQTNLRQWIWLRIVI